MRRIHGAWEPMARLQCFLKHYLSPGYHRTYAIRRRLKALQVGLTA